MYNPAGRIPLQVERESHVRSSYLDAHQSRSDPNRRNAEPKAASHDNRELTIASSGGGTSGPVPSGPFAPGPLGIEALTALILPVS
jgi:hypothetical protein